MLSGLALFAALAVGQTVDGGAPADPAATAADAAVTSALNEAASHRIKGANASNAAADTLYQQQLSSFREAQAAYQRAKAKNDQDVAAARQQETDHEAEMDAWRRRTTAIEKRSSPPPQKQPARSDTASDKPAGESGRGACRLVKETGSMITVREGDCGRRDKDKTVPAEDDDPIVCHDVEMNTGRGAMAKHRDCQRQSFWDRYAR